MLWAIYVLYSSKTNINFLVRANSDRQAWRNLAVFLQKGLAEVIDGGEFSIKVVITKNNCTEVKIEGLCIYVEV